MLKCTLRAAHLELGGAEQEVRRGGRDLRVRISASEVYNPVNTCSCLTMILAGIVYWQARGISGITAAPDFLVR